MKRLFTLPLIALTVIAVGCDSAASDPGNSDEVDAVRSAFRSARATPLASKSSSGEQEYLLEVRFDPDAGVRLPDGVNVLPQSEGVSSTPVWDNGQGFDAVAGDGIFTAVVPGGCVPMDDASSDSAGKSSEVGVSCGIDFVGPGQECGNWGTCPDRVHRSFLWGLIEYDTDIVLCFCLTDCDVEVKK